MSEPVTHSEIEDVLSSIRRLVSETSRTEGSASPARDEGKPATRLVLTPALRVPASDVRDDTPETGQGAQPHQAFNANEHATVVAVFKSDPTLPADDSSATTEQPDKITDVDLSTRHDPINDQSRSEATRILASAAKPPSQDDAARRTFAEPSPCEVSSVTDADEEIAEAPFIAVEDNDGGGAADPILLRMPTSLPEGVPSRDVAVDAPWRDPEAKLFDSLSDTDATETVQDAAPKGEEPPREQSARVAAVVRRIAELETAGRSADEAGTARNGTAVPDLNEDDIEAVPHSGPSFETIQWEDHQQDDAGTASFVSAREPAEDQAGALTRGATEEVAMEALSSAEEFLDEDALRELVSDIVREELQGVLGERITRNVRKLVRREIQRALASQELL